ncbi:putative F-box protein-like isoform X4 [Capsicum annuum]|nr:putative F-box protein-like isoform X4 [Capsicum annuum]KAF3674310.1 putative F-box protein-like isoform X4 [Capsicum annuum]
MGFYALLPLTCGVPGIFFYFWNPSIKKSVKLPVPGYTCGKFDTFGYTLGFGLDPVTNDYKEVRVVHTTHHPMRPHVDLYKLSTGVWEDISHVSLSYLFHATTPQAVSSGPNELEIANDFIKPMDIRKNGEILWEANQRKKLLVFIDDIVEKSKDVDHGLRNGHGRPPLIHWIVKIP